MTHVAGNTCASSKKKDESNACLWISSCDAERNKSSEGHDVTLPRKASSQNNFTRTANRHR